MLVPSSPTPLRLFDVMTLPSITIPDEEASARTSIREFPEDHVSGERARRGSEASIVDDEASLWIQIPMPLGSATRLRSVNAYVVARNGMTRAVQHDPVRCEWQ